jgi:hypothetical protein
MAAIEEKTAWARQIRRMRRPGSLNHEDEALRVQKLVAGSS